MLIYNSYSIPASEKLLVVKIVTIDRNENPSTLRHKHELKT